MRQFLLILALAMFSFTLHSQVININGIETVLTTTGDVPDDLKAIQHKKYLTQDYKPAYVDELKQRAFLRYNIFDDQMEFLKGDKVYYLKKDAGRTIKFADNSMFRVYDHNGEMIFFQVHTEGEMSLIAKQVVKFIEAQKATSGYDRDKPADYKRRNDEYYIVISGKLMKVPSKKKEFYALFGDHASKAKTYMKKNKLGYKKIDDLKKVISYMNTL